MDRAELIKEHIDKIKPLISKYARRYPKKASDIKSAAHLGLCQAVEWIMEGRAAHGNYTGYIILTVKSFITNFIIHDHVVYIPKCKSSPHPIEDYKDILVANNEGEPDKKSEILSRLFEGQDWTLRQIKIIQCMMKGYTQIEICEELNIGRTTLYYDLKIIKEALR